VYSGWQPGVRAATLKGTAIWTWARVGCFHNLFLDSIRLTVEQDCFANSTGAVTGDATTLVPQISCDCLSITQGIVNYSGVLQLPGFCWSRSSSLSVLHSEYQVVWRQSHRCLWGSVPVSSKHLWKSTEIFFMLFSICCWPMFECLCTRWSTWTSVSGKGIHHVMELVNYSGSFWFQSMIMYPHYFGIFIISVVHF
jgi:hypothetical protein